MIRLLALEGLDGFAVGDVSHLHPVVCTRKPPPMCVSVAAGASHRSPRPSHITTRALHTS